MRNRRSAVTAPSALRTPLLLAYIETKATGDAMRKALMVFLATTSACSDNRSDEVSNLTYNATPSVSSKAQLSRQPDTIETGAGQYRVERVVGGPKMPMNTDLEMMDGDEARYAAQVCELEWPQEAPSKCVVYVNADTGKLLTGVVVLKEREGVAINTALETSRVRGGTGCYISGKLVDSFGEANGLSLKGDFEGRMPFWAWQKEPGKWLVTNVDPDDYDNYGAGVWYFNRIGNKLRVSQERWNYCFSDDNAVVDQAFTEAMTLTKI